MPHIQYPLEEIEDGAGNDFLAYNATCYCTPTGTDSFHYYHPQDLNHPHIQCTTCGQSYCPPALCTLPTALPVVEEDT